MASPVGLPMTTVLGKMDDPPDGSGDLQLKHEGLNEDCGAYPFVQGSVYCAATGAETLVYSLIKVYADDEQIVRIVEALIDRYINGKGVEAMQTALAMAGDFSEQKIEAIRVVEQLAITHAKWELEPVVQYLYKFEERYYLTWFRRELITA